MLSTGIVKSSRRFVWSSTRHRAPWAEWRKHNYRHMSTSTPDLHRHINWFDWNGNFLWVSSRVITRCGFVGKWTWTIDTMHSWPQCPEGDISPEAILSRAFGTSRTTIHHQVTLWKGPEWLHKPMYDFETPLRFCLGGHFLLKIFFCAKKYFWEIWENIW